MTKPLHIIEHQCTWRCVQDDCGYFVGDEVIFDRYCSEQMFMHKQTGNDIKPDQSKWVVKVSMLMIGKNND